MTVVIEKFVEAMCCGEEIPPRPEFDDLLVERLGGDCYVRECPFCRNYGARAVQRLRIRIVVRPTYKPSYGHNYKKPVDR